MKRGKPLRRTPLRAKTRLARRTPLRQESAKRAAAAGRPRRPADTGPDRATRELVLQRDDYRCVLCGEPIFGKAYSLHHRKNRGAGGSSDAAINAPSNLVTVDGTGSSGCHNWIGSHPALAAELGLVVSLNGRTLPAQVPILHAVHGWVLLDDEGGGAPAPPDAGPGTERRAA